MKLYPEEAIARARDEAAAWLGDRGNGYPRSWEQEARDDIRRGYVMYDDFEAPPIAGYEALERDGLVERVGVAVREDGQERIHFRVINPPLRSKEK